jgi:hypothetical protein
LEQVDISLADSHKYVRISIYKKNSMPENITSNNTQNVEKYRDLEGITLNKLSFGLWWVKNRSGLRKTLITFLIIICSVSWGYTLINWGYYYAVGYQLDEQMTAQLVQTSTVHQSYLLSKAAKPAIVQQVGVIENDGMYDLYAILKNINTKHIGQLSYCFMSGTEELSCGKDFILPGEQKYFLALAKDLERRPSSINFRINRQQWSKLNPHDYPNWSRYRSAHLDFPIGETDFIPAVDSERSEKLKLNLLKFSITNNTPYNYYEAPLNIVIFRRGKIVGVSRYVIKYFDSNMTEDIEITWPGAIMTVDEVEIIPDINIIDESVYSS